MFLFNKRVLLESPERIIRVPNFLVCDSNWLNFKEGVVCGNKICHFNYYYNLLYFIPKLTKKARVMTRVGLEYGSVWKLNLSVIKQHNKMGKQPKTKKEIKDFVRRNN